MDKNICHTPYRVELFMNSAYVFDFESWSETLHYILQSEHKEHVIMFPLSKDSPRSHHEHIEDEAVWEEEEDIKELMCHTVGRFFRDFHGNLPAYHMYHSIVRDHNSEYVVWINNKIRDLENCYMEQNVPVTPYFEKFKEELDLIANSGWTLPHKDAMEILLECLAHPYKEYVLESNVDVISMSISDLQKMVEEREKYVTRDRVSYRICSITGNRVLRII